MKENDLIGFILISLSTEQFALLEEDINLKDKFGLQTQVRFGVNNVSKLIAVFVKFRFEYDEKPFIILEVSSQFKIKDENWINLIDESENKIILPRNFALHLAVLTIGAARGILHAKTENSVYHHLLLPTINVTEIIVDDVTLDLENT